MSCVKVVLPLKDGKVKVLSFKDNQERDEYFSKPENASARRILQFRIQNENETERILGYTSRLVAELTSDLRTKEALDNYISLNQNRHPLFNATLDKGYFNNSNVFEQIAVDEAFEKEGIPSKDNYLAPTWEKHQEGQAFINGLKFKPGVTIYHAVSPYIPYNKNLISQGKLNQFVQNGRLSSIVFTDKFDNPMDHAFIMANKNNLSKLVSKGDLKIKYIGTPYEYTAGRYAQRLSNDPYSRESASIIMRSRFIRSVKENLIPSDNKTADVIVTDAIGAIKDTLFIDFAAPEILQEVIGNNFNFDGIVEDEETNKIGFVWKTLKKLTYLQEAGKIPAIGIAMGHREGNISVADKMVIPSLNIEVPFENIMGKLNPKPGEAWLFVPVNKKTNIEKDGVFYQPIILQVKNLASEQYPDSPGIPVMSRFSKLLNSYLKGKIVRTTDPSGRVVIQDTVTVTYKNLGKMPAKAAYIENLKALNDPIFTEYVKSTPNPSDFGFAEYLETLNPIITGNRKYPSLTGRKELLTWAEAIKEIIGFENNAETKDELDLIKMLDEAVANNETLEQFIPKIYQRYGANRMQVDVTRLADPEYIDNWIDAYGILKTHLNADRPYHSNSFITERHPESVKVKEATPLSRAQEMIDKLFGPGNSMYSSDFSGATLTRKEVEDWVKVYFPKAHVNLVDYLIEGVYSGEYNKVTNAITLAENWVNQRVLAEEFGHFIFEKLPEQTKNEIFEELKEKYPDYANNKRELEELLMMELKNNTKQLSKPKNAIERFFYTVIEFIQNLFEKKTEINKFLTRFQAGFYSNIPGQIQGQKVSSIFVASPKTRTMEDQNPAQLDQLLKYLSRNIIDEIVGEVSLISLLETNNKIRDTDFNQSFDDFINNRLKQYIKIKRVWAINLLKKEGLNLKEDAIGSEIYAEYKKAVSENKPVSSLGVSAVYQSEVFNQLLELLDEPMFVTKLYKEVGIVYGINLKNYFDENAKDGLGLVKAADINIDDDISPELRRLIVTIPDIHYVDETIETPGYTLNTDTNYGYNPVPITDLKGVVFGDYIYDKQLKLEYLSPERPNKGVYPTYDFNVYDRIDYLLRVLADANTSKKMLEKLTDLKLNGDPWARIFAYKVLEAYNINSDGPLIKSVWMAFGQKRFLTALTTSRDANNRPFSYFANVRKQKDKVLRNIATSLRNFGYKADGTIYTPEEQKELIIEIIKGYNFLTSKKTAKQKEALWGVIDKYLNLVGVSIQKEDILKLKAGVEGKAKLKKIDIIEELILLYKDRVFDPNYYEFVKGKPVFVKDNINKLVDENGFLRVGISVINDENLLKRINNISEYLSKAGVKEKKTSFRDPESNLRNSYSYPNFLTEVFQRLLTDKDFNDSYFMMLGYRFNPLMQDLNSKLNPTRLSKAPQDLSENEAYVYKLFTYQGDNNSKKTFEAMNFIERELAMLNLSLDGAQRESENSDALLGKGYFSYGNIGDSYTNYMLRAPLLNSMLVYNNFFQSLYAEVDVLTSVAEQFDSAFANDKGKGILLFPEVNSIIFGSAKNGVYEINNELREQYLANITLNKDRLIEIIKANLEKRFKEYYQKIINEGFDENLEKLNPLLVQEVYDETLEDYRYEVNKTILKTSFFNKEYYSVMMNRLTTVHPAFFSEYINFSKRVKQVHTSGTIPWESPKNATPTLNNYIVLADKKTSFDEVLLEFIRENAKAFLKGDPETGEPGIAEAAFMENKGSDSGAYMSIKMLKQRNKEHKGWNDFDEYYYEAQMQLNVAGILEYESKVDFAPLKLGAYTVRQARNAFNELIGIPTVQKYAFTVLLPSEAFAKKDGTISRPDESIENIEERYKDYVNPDLARLQFEYFEKDVDYAYYQSGGKIGMIKPFNLSNGLEALKQSMPASAIKQVTKQPNKNTLNKRTLGIQGRFIVFGLIDPTKTYLINGVPTNGADVRAMFDQALAKLVDLGIKELPFIIGNKNTGAYKLDKAALVKFLSEYLDSKNGITADDIASLELVDGNFGIPLQLGAFADKIFNTIRSKLNDAVEIKVKAPSYKNVYRSKELNYWIEERNGKKGITVEARVAMWPELERYYKRKLRKEKIDSNDLQGQRRIKKQIIARLEEIGFRGVYNRIPTEHAYSFFNLKIIDFLPTSLGNSIELADGWITQSGGDLDGDALFGLMSLLDYGEGINMIESSLENATGIQNLLAEIYSQVLFNHPSDQFIPGEYNEILDIANKRPIDKSIPIGTTMANYQAQALNDIGDKAIGKIATTNGILWYLKGFDNKVELTYRGLMPYIIKPVNPNILNFESINGKTKLEISNQMVSASVNHPKDAAFTKMGLNEEEANLLNVLISVLGVDLNEAIDFMLSPEITQYRTRLKKTSLNPDKKNQQKAKLHKEYFPKMKAPEIELMALTDPNVTSISELTTQELVAKYIVLEKFAKAWRLININLPYLLKGDNQDQAQLYRMITGLQDIRLSFEGIEKIMPVLRLEDLNSSAKTVYEYQNSISDWINKATTATTLKYLIAYETTDYFTPTYKKIIDTLLSQNVYLNEQYKEINDLLSRFVYSYNSDVKGFSKVLHLGATIEDPAFHYALARQGKYTLDYMINKVNKDYANILLNPTLPGVVQGSEQYRAYELYKRQIEQIKYSLQNITVNTNNAIKIDATPNTPAFDIGKLALAEYGEDLQTIELWQAGFKAMLNIKNPLDPTMPELEYHTFAKDLMDYTVYSGWDREGNNIAGIIPRSAYRDRYNLINLGTQYNNVLAAMSKDGSPLMSEFMAKLVLYDPKNYSPWIHNYSSQKEEGKKVVFYHQSDKNEALSSFKKTVWNKLRIEENYLRSRGLYKNDTPPVFLHMSLGNSTLIYKLENPKMLTYNLFGVNKGKVFFGFHDSMFVDFYKNTVFPAFTQKPVAVKPTAISGQPLQIINYEWKRTSRKEGTLADKAMREAADAFVGEATTMDSSTYTSAQFIADKVENSVNWNRQSNTVVAGKSSPKVVMLARNGNLKDKPLSTETIKVLDRLKERGNITFVVGDMVGVDSYFIEYLQQNNLPYIIHGHGRFKGVNATVTEDIYSKLGKITQSKNVILPKDVDPEADNIGMTYTTPIDFWRKIVPEAMALFNKRKPLIVAFRGNSKKTFLENYKSGTYTIGNPFNWQDEKGTQQEQGIASTKKFIEWMISGNNFGNANATEEYRQAIITDIKSGKIKGSSILYYQEKNYATHATALDYLINEFDWEANTFETRRKNALNYMQDIMQKNQSIFSPEMYEDITQMILEAKDNQALDNIYINLKRHCQ